MSPVFKPYYQSETEKRNGKTYTVVTRMQCITVCGNYKNISFEELRLEDYRTRKWGLRDCTTPYRATRHLEYDFVKGRYIEVLIQSITGIKEYAQTSFEELRLLDYKHGKGPKVHKMVFGFDFGATSTPGTSGNVFGATQANTGLFGQQNASMVGGTGGGLFGGVTYFAVPFRETFILGDGMFHSITSMHKYKHLSFEELRLLDYNRGKGPKQHKLVFGKGFSPVPNQIDCNIWNNLNITANLLAPHQEQQIIQPKHQYNKRCKITDANSSPKRQPFQFNTDALNKSPSTAIVDPYELFKFNTASLNESLETTVLAQNTNEPLTFNTDALNKSPNTAIVDPNELFKFNTASLNKSLDIAVLTQNTDEPFTFNTASLNRSLDTAVLAQTTNEPLTFNTASLNESPNNAIVAQNTKEPLTFNTAGLNKSLDTAVLAQNSNEPLTFNTASLNKSFDTTVLAQNTDEPLTFNTASLNKSLDIAVLTQNTDEPLMFNTASLNKSLDTAVLTQNTKLGDNNDGYNNDTNTSSDNDVSGFNGKKKVQKDNEKGNEEHGDVMVLVGNETALQSLTDNLTSGDCSSTGEVKSNITSDFEDSSALEQDVSVSINIRDLLGINLEPPNKVTIHTKSDGENVCYDNSHNITVMSQPSTSNDGNKLKNIDNDTGNKTSVISLNINVTDGSSLNDFNNRKTESKDINTAGECSSITDTIDVLPIENNSQKDNPVNHTAIHRKNNTNQEFNSNDTNNLADNKPVVVDISLVAGGRSTASEVGIQFNNGNISEVADDLPLNKGSNFLNDKDISRSSLDDGVALNKETTNLDLEPELSQSLPEQIDQNNVIDDNAEPLTDDLNNNNSNKIEEKINLFSFDAVPKPRMVVKPSKLQFNALKTPNTKTVFMPKTISNGYPFFDSNSKNRSNFNKDYTNKKAVLNAHLQLFANDTPKPVINDTSAPSATAPYIRKFTPFSFQKSNTANPNASSDTATSSTPTSQNVSSSVDPDLIRLLQKRNLLHPKKQSSGATATVGRISKPNASALFKSSTINSTTSTSPTAFPPVSNSKELSIPSTISNNSKALPSNFGVDIINYGASTSKQCTNIESISSKGDIAPTFKDLSVSNETDLDGMESESEKATIALAIRNLPASMSIDELDAEDRSDDGSANQFSVYQSIDQESNSQPKLSTDVRSETVSVVSAFKGSSLPSLFKGKSILKKSSTTKGSVPLNTNCLEFNKPSLDSFLISPQTEPSKGSASGAQVRPISTTATSSTSSSLTAVKNQFYLESKEDLPIKKNIVAPFKQFTFTNTKPAFDFAKMSTVSGIFSFNPTDSRANSSRSASLPTVNMLGNNISNSASLSVQNVSYPLDQSSSQSLSSVFNDINILSDSLSQTNASELQKPSQSPQSSNNTFLFPLSPARPIQINNSTPAITADTKCSLFNELNAATIKNTTPAIKPDTSGFLNFNKANASTAEKQNTTPAITPDAFGFLNLSNGNAGTKHKQNTTPAFEPDTFGFLNLKKTNASTAEKQNTTPAITLDADAFSFLNVNSVNAGTKFKQNTTPAIKPDTFGFLNLNKANALTRRNTTPAFKPIGFLNLKKTNASTAVKQNASPAITADTFGFLNLNNSNAGTKHKQNTTPAFKPDTFGFSNLNNSNSGSRHKQNMNTTPAVAPDTRFGFLNEVNAATNQIQNTISAVAPDTRSGFLTLNNPYSFTNLNLNNTKAKKQDKEFWASEAQLSVKIHETPMQGLVLHREKMRYNNLSITDGNVDNIGIPRNLYFFSAIPIILNQMFTLEVQELFDRTNNDISIGFTATDPFGINVLELPDNPMLLMNRQEYWAFKTFKFSKDIYKDDEIRFILRSNGAMRFYKQQLHSEYFVDTTVTLWLFVHVKCGIKKFSLTTNEKSYLSVHHAMNEPPENMPNPNDISRNDTRAVVDFLQSAASSNSRTQGLWEFQNPPADLRNTMTRNVDNIGVQNINLLRRESGFPYRSGNLFETSEQRRNYIDSFMSNLAQDRIRESPTEFREQPNSVIDNMNSIWTPFSNVTDPDLGVSQSNQSGNVNKSNLPVISKSRRQEGENECIICYDKDIDCVLYKCGHSCMCMECSVTIQRQGDSKCPICRNIICDVIKIYKS